MNRLEAIAKLNEINKTRIDVHGKILGVGFFLGDAIAALETFERASRVLSTLTKNGRVRCNVIQMGGSRHDLYTLLPR